MSDGRVSVTIYGQNYVVSGGDEERTVRVAAYVDDSMSRIGEVLNASISDIAVLSALNIADAFFAYKESMRDVERNLDAIEAEKKRYAALWEEAKGILQRYKDESRKFADKRDEMQAGLTDKNKEIDEYKQKISELEKKLANAVLSGGESVDERIRELESDCFDLEMENVRLKNELSKLRQE